MAIVVAYMDDSGTHRESPAIVVAGCVGLADHWDAFVPRWQSILRAFGVACHHNVDCAHFSGEYKVGMTGQGLITTVISSMR